MSLDTETIVGGADCTATFIIPGPVPTRLDVTEVDGILYFELTVLGGGPIGDLRALYLDFGAVISGDSLLVEGEHVTDYASGEDTVTTLGADTNLHGSTVGQTGAFDLGIAFGTPGIAEDDIQTTTFTVSSLDGPLSIDMLAGSNIGLRYTSVGDPFGEREGGAKFAGTLTEWTPLVAVDDAFSARAGDELVIAAPGLLGNDLVTSDGLTTVEITRAPQHGTASLSEDGRLVYLASEYVGLDSFAYSISHPDGRSDEAEVLVHVVGNLPPVARPDAWVTAAGTPLVVAGAQGLLANDVDPEGDALALSEILSGPTGGTLAASEDGGFVYTPLPGFSGTDTFTYQVSDRLGASSSATATLTVLPDRPPVTAPDVFGMRQGDTLTVQAAGLLANDVDPEGRPLEVLGVVSGPAAGVLDLGDDGAFVYTPDASFSGVDGFVYKVADDYGNEAEATVSISVIPNRGPLAVADAWAVAAGQTLSISPAGVLANDFDPEGDGLALSRIVSGPANGTLASRADGGFDYTPQGGFSGSDSFVYEIVDPFGNSSEATVALTVLGPGSLNVTAVSDAYAVRRGEMLTVPAAMGMLANDVDADDDALTVGFVGVSGQQGVTAEGGNVTRTADGAFTYTPPSGFTGADQFFYIAFDADFNVSQGQVTVEVLPNLTPLPHPDFYVVGEDRMLEVGTATGILANDVDPEGDLLTVGFVGTGGKQGETAQGGTVDVTPDGSFTYVPRSGYHGPDSFAYIVFDPLHNASQGLVSIEVLRNLPPVAAPDSYAAVQAQMLTVDASVGLLANDLDPEGTGLTVTLVGFTSDSEIEGEIDWTPDGGFTYFVDNIWGTATLAYIAVDEDGNPVQGEFEIEVARNKSPLVLDDAYAVVSGDTLSIDATRGVLANDIDPEDDPFEIVNVFYDGDGTLEWRADGSFDYTPAPGFSGEDRFAYIVANDVLANAVQGDVTLFVLTSEDLLI